MHKGHPKTDFMPQFLFTPKIQIHKDSDHNITAVAAMSAYETNISTRNKSIIFKV